MISHMKTLLFIWTPPLFICSIYKICKIICKIWTPPEKYAKICTKIKNIKILKYAFQKEAYRCGKPPFEIWTLAVFIYMLNMQNMHNMQKYASWSHYLACVAQLGAQVLQWTYSVAVQQSDWLSFRPWM